MICWNIYRVKGAIKTLVGVEYTTLNGKARHAVANAYASGKYPPAACLEAFFSHIDFSK